MMIFHYSILFLCILQFAHLCPGQNLVPNGGFENPQIRHCDDIATPTKNIGYFFPNWYGDGWIYSDLCPSHFDRPTIRWDWRYSVPYKGKCVAQIWTSSWDDGVFTPWGVSTSLKSPLEANQFYYLEMYVLNRGIEDYGNMSYDCIESPARHIKMYVSDESIEAVVDANGNLLLDTYTSSGRIIGIDSSEYLNSKAASNSWKHISSCFQAMGGESHLGIMPSIGRFKHGPGCQVTDQTILYESAFYELDEVNLFPIPTELSAEVEICINKADSIHLLELVPFGKASFLWPDGSTDSVRVLREGGRYEIEVQLPCTSLPFYLNVNSKDCSTKLFVPNAFSPNGDGVNEEFGPSFQAYWQTEYFHFRIFNRWGKLVFESSNPSQKWNGMINNFTAQEGIYVWTLEYLIQEENATKQIKSGSFLLFR